MRWNNQEVRFIQVITEWIRLNVHAKVADHAHAKTKMDFATWALTGESANKVWTQTHMTSLRKTDVRPQLHAELLAEAVRRVVRHDFRHPVFEGLSLEVRDDCVVFVAADKK